jgi:ABC-2 type transport system permease protein
MKENISLRLKKVWRKYTAVFRISLANILEYRANFLVGRIRNLIVLLTLYFLWTAVFPAQGSLFGYQKAQILTYIFGIHILRSIVLTTATYNVAAEITQGGKFFSYLLRPISYAKYWFSVDLSYKIIEAIASLIEIAIIFWLFKISLFFQINPLFLLFAIIFVFLAIILNFYLGYLIALIAFWTPQAWGPRFLFDLLLSFFAGAFFPLDVFPQNVQFVFNSLPFPYLLFFPLKIYLGRIDPIGIFVGFTFCLGWILVTYLAISYVWQKGLRVYEGGGI